MNLLCNDIYNNDLSYITSLNLPWEKLYRKSILITGASGLIGSCLVDALMTKNANGLGCTVYAVGRNAGKAESRFSKWVGSPFFQFISHDINDKFVRDDLGTVDFVLHMASNTHPVQYSTDPIGTITTNIIGVKNMLDFAVSHHATRFMFTSSNEIYGENRGDAELFDENYCGYINCNTMRAGYPESKRCGEALCQAYRVQKGLDVVIPRLTRSYGPTMLMTDTKAISQFIKNAINKEDIVLKSKGDQYYSYTYMADAVTGLLTVLLCGEPGEAYNIADEASDITLRDLAITIADCVGRKVIFEIPNEIETAGYSKATKARLNGAKIKELGWQAKFDIKTGIERTISAIMSMHE